MQYLQQVATMVPFGTTALTTAESVCQYSVRKSAATCSSALDRIDRTRKEYVQFRRNVEKMLGAIAQETVNEVLMRAEDLVGVPKERRSPEDMEHLRQRVQAIYQTILSQHIMKSRLVTGQASQALIKRGRQLTRDYMVPMYIRIKAVLIVSRQMLMEFLTSTLGELKLTYENSKDSIVMLVKGDFNEESVKQRMFQGIEHLKRTTVSIVGKGLQIRMDRASLMDNYDKFAANFLETMKEIRQRSGDNVQKARKRTKDLYREALSRIRAKELQLKTEMRERQLEQRAYPQLTLLNQ